MRLKVVAAAAASASRQPLDNGASPAAIEAVGAIPAGLTGGSNSTGRRLDEAVQTQASLLADESKSKRTTKEVRYFGRQTDYFGSDEDQYLYLDDYDAHDDDDDEELNETGRRRSVSLNDILAGSFVHEAATGEQIIVSRGWPQPRAAGRRRRRSGSFSGGCGDGARHPQVRLRSRLNEAQKRKLLVQFLGRQRPISVVGGGGRGQKRPVAISIQSNRNDVESAMRLVAGSSSHAGVVGSRSRRASILKLNVRRAGSRKQYGSQASAGADRKVAAYQDDDDDDTERLAGERRHHRPTIKQRLTTGKNLTVQYDLPPPPVSDRPIALGQN